MSEQSRNKSVIMSTVSKTNMDEIPDIIDEVVKAKVKVFAFSRYVPTGGEVDTSMTPEEYRKLLEVCDAKYKAYEKAGCETYFNKRIICGRCMNMKRDSLSFLRVQRQE